MRARGAYLKTHVTLLAIFCCCLLNNFNRRMDDGVTFYKHFIINKLKQIA